MLRKIKIKIEIDKKIIQLITMIIKSDELLLKKYIRKECNFVTDIDILDIDIREVGRAEMVYGDAVCLFYLKNKENVCIHGDYVYFDEFNQFKKQEREDKINELLNIK